MAGDLNQTAELRRLIEELRMDVHDRFSEMDEPKKEKDPMQDAVAMVATLHAVQGALEPLTAAIQHATAATERDAARDGEVSQILRSVATEMKALRKSNEKLAKAFDEFVTTMRTPKTRTAVVDLPDGQASVTITESRERK